MPETAPKYRVEDLEVRCDPEEVVKTYLDRFLDDDFLGDYTRCLSFLPYSVVSRFMRQDARVPEKRDVGVGVLVSPPKLPPRGLELRWIPESEWVASTTKDLREAVAHYRDWWRQKVEDGRGISVGRGTALLTCYLLVAGCPEWRELHEMDGGWYQEDAYNFVADLFGWPHVQGYRD